MCFTWIMHICVCTGVPVCSVYVQVGGKTLLLGLRKEEKEGTGIEDIGQREPYLYLQCSNFLEGETSRVSYLWNS